jgi:predicted amidohydrolase
VIAFPEGFIPAHPVWYHNHAASGAIANQLAVELFKNSVEIPGPETAALWEAARDANAYVVIGVCEKMPGTIGTMFNRQLYIGPDGILIRKHQKIMPTVGERLFTRAATATHHLVLQDELLRPGDGGVGLGLAVLDDHLHLRASELTLQDTG